MATVKVGSIENRLSHPPACSAAWSDAERNRYVAWLAATTLDRISRDDPDIPVVAKTPIRDLFLTAHRVLTWPAEKLERSRAALMKPYDRGLDRHGVLLPTDVLNVIRGGAVACTRCGLPFRPPTPEYAAHPGRVCGSCADDLRQEADAEAGAATAAAEGAGEPETDLF